MMTMINTLPKNPGSWKLSFPESKYVRSRSEFFSLAACSHRTICALSSKYYSRSCSIHVAQPNLVSNNKKIAWSIRSSVDGSGFDPSSTDSPNGGTRLIRTIQAFQTKLSARIREIRKGLPMKLLFFLVGFYCATAFATAIGQTGDWDVLSAALAVVVVEAIGALMYRASLPLVSKLKSLITMFNYWKAGLSLGLFLDSFKYEMDNIIESSNPFNFEIDIFSISS